MKLTKSAGKYILAVAGGIATTAAHKTKLDEEIESALAYVDENIHMYQETINEKIDPIIQSVKDVMVYPTEDEKERFIKGSFNLFKSEEKDVKLNDVNPKVVPVGPNPVAFTEEELLAKFPNMRKLLSGSYDAAESLFKNIAPVVQVRAISYASNSLFDKFFEATQTMEGRSRYENVKSDLGGITSWGISTKANPDLADRLKVGLSYEEARDIVYSRYFVTIPLIEKVDPRLAFIIFDSRFTGIIENLYIIQNHINDTQLYNASEKLTKLNDRRFMLLVSKMSPTDVEIVLNKIRSESKFIARRAADRTMRAQNASGMEEYDFYNGFYNRQRKRLDFASNLEVSG